MSDLTKAVFLSYASQDAEAVERIAAALRTSGVEVWFDKNELVGGDAWDAKIRGQISSCALFVSVISAATQARGEGYFRLEWKLAVDRSHLMAHDQPFLLPVVIDATKDGEARVPPEFRAVQWTRLPAGETPPAFCARVKKLLGGEAAVAGSEVGARPVRAQEDGRGPAAPLRKPTRPWLVPAILGVAAVAALAIWQPWRAKEKSPPPASTAAAVAPAAQLTEAQQLVAKARKIFDEGDEMNRETYLLTEDLLKKAEAIDVTEASAWSLHAGASSQSYLYGLDTSPSRREAMLSQAARAEKLAPGSVEAVVARAQVRIALRQDLAGLQRELGKFAEAHPTEISLLRALGQSYGLSGKTEESLQSVRRALQLTPDDPRLKADLINSLRVANRLGEAEAAVKEALKGRASGRLLVVDVIIKMIWRGDAPAAAAAAQSWPSWLVLEDRGAAWAALACSWNKEPAKALEILRNFPRDEFRDIFLSGPRAAFSALAHEQAGQEESARADWRAALQVAERSLAVSADDLVALHWKAWALFRLGDSAGAATAYNLLREKTATGPGGLYTFGGLAGLALTAGRTEDALVCLQNLQTMLMTGNLTVRAVTKAMLRANPVFDPLRSDPRFQALIDAAPGPEEKKGNASAAAAALDPKSVAVLAFADNSPAHDSEYFSDGISEELINALGKVQGLKVPARTSSFYFKGKSVPVPEIAKQLGVAYVIEGSVQRMGEKVKISARLSKAADGFQVWTESFLRDAKDVFAVEEEIAGLIAKQLSLKLGVSSAAATASVNPEALGLLLEARYYWNQRGEQNFDRAEMLLNRALAIDPTFARAHSALADVWVMRASYRLLDGGANVARELQNLSASAMRASELDPTLVDPVAARAYGLMFENRMEEAGKLFAEALGRSPDNPTFLYWRGLYFMNQGDFLAAKRDYERSRSFDPMAFIVWHNSSECALALGSYDEAAAFAARAHEVRRGGFVQSLATGAMATWLAGRREEAVTLARSTRQPELQQFQWIKAGYAVWVLRQAGLETEAASYGAEELRTLPANSYQRGFLLAGLGRFSEARSYLEQMPAYILYQLASSPIFDLWRDDSQFKALVEKLHWSIPYTKARAMRSDALRH